MIYTSIGKHVSNQIKKKKEKNIEKRNTKNQDFN